MKYLLLLLHTAVRHTLGKFYLSSPLFYFIVRARSECLSVHMGSQSKVQDSQDPSQEHSQSWLRLDPSFPCFPFIFSTSSSSFFLFFFFFYYNMYNTSSRENPRESNRKDQFRSHGVFTPFQGSSSSCYTRILPSQRQSVNNIVADCILGIGKS